MNGNFLLLANEIWIKLYRMIVDLKSLKKGFQDERNWHEDWDHREYRDIVRKCGIPNSMGSSGFRLEN